MHSTNITTGAQQSMHAPIMSPRKEHTCITKHHSSKCKLQKLNHAGHKHTPYKTNTKYQKRIPLSENNLVQKRHILILFYIHSAHLQAVNRMLMPAKNISALLTTPSFKKKKEEMRHKQAQQDNKYPLQYTPSSGDRQGTKTKTEEKASIGGAPCTRGGCTRGSHRQRRQQQQQRGGVPSLSPS